MDNKFFNDTSLVIKENQSELTSEKILETLPLQFPKKEDFVGFYCKYNGLIFPFGAFFYRDSFYEVSSADYNLLDIGAFLDISESDNSIQNMWKSLKKKERTKNISKNHLPFALDSSGNMFCIQLKSGIIYYLPHESPLDLTEVAPTFLDFCKNIRGEMR